MNGIFPEDDTDDEGHEASADDGARPKTEKDTFDDLRSNRSHPDIQAATSADGTFSTLKLHSMHRSKRPVHKVMAQRVLCDLPSEASSERSFSTAGMYHSKLRKTLGPEIASMMVMCNKNHGALFEKIKGKILARYKEKYRKTAGAFDTPDDNFDNDDE